MKHRATDDFWKCYESLPQNIQRQAKLSFRRLLADPSHPSLQFGRITDKKNLWSARFGSGYRALAEKIDATYVWDWLGPHDEYLRQIKLRR